jgi:hypothetical protein
MNYKLKSEPEVIYYMETKEFIIEDENGVEHTIRVSEHSKGIDFLIDTGRSWEDITDRELKTWIIEDLPEEEVQK